MTQGSSGIRGLVQSVVGGPPLVVGILSNFCWTIVAAGEERHGYGERWPEVAES